MHQRDDGGDVGRDLHDGERPCWDPAPADGEPGDGREHEVAGGRRREEPGIAVAEDALLGRRKEQHEQHRRQ